MNDDLRIDDEVRLKKPHPCGGYRWRVARLGADIRLVCLSCGRRIMLPRSELRRRIRGRRRPGHPGHPET